MASLWDMLMGTGEQIQRINPLRPEQQRLYQQQQRALSGQGAGGAFGDSADYYRRLLSGGEDAAFEAPLMRQFQEDIMPDIAEQFAGMGSGALSSSGFQQAASRGATDLAERLGSIRAGLRMQGAQGLQSMAMGGLSPIDEMVLRPREPGLIENMASGVGSGFGAGFGLAGAGKLASSLPFLNK